MADGAEWLFCGLCRHNVYWRTNCNRCPQHALSAWFVLLFFTIKHHREPQFFGRPFVKRFALCYRTVVCLSDCDVGVLWPNGWMY